MNKREMLTAEQRRIFQSMVNGENIFLTGNAGTGKSFLVEAFDEYCQDNDIKLLKAAPTGVAACNIGGTTLHRLFGLPLNVNDMLKKEKSIPEKLEKILNLASVILIDEISMVRIDTFDRIMNYIRLANFDRRMKNRSEIQIILVGDFYQLAPVIPPEDKKVLDIYYGRDIGNGFAFQSTFWRSLNIKFEKLTEIIRQSGDKKFCVALDKCKEGDPDCLSFFAKNTAEKEIANAIWLCGKNATAFEKNTAKLSKLKGKSKTFHTEYDGNANAKDRLCDDTFECKKGARVLMLVNDVGGLYQNGSMGTIHSITDEGIWVNLDQRGDNGEEKKPLKVLISRYDFKKYDYGTKLVTEKVTDERGEVQTKKHEELVLKEVGSAKQFPMKLGFAITVHKAQGQTYDEMNFAPEIFQDGQLYVALSRCRHAETIYISNPLSDRMVRTSQEVVNYYKNPENYSFFGKENDIISVQTSRECEGVVKLLTKVFPNHKSEVLNFLQALEHKDEAEIGA